MSASVPDLSALSPRELECAGLAAQGLTNKEIQTRLGVTSVDTVKTQLARVYHKLGVRNRTELAVRLAAGRVVVGELRAAEEVSYLLGRLRATRLDQRQRELVDQLVTLVAEGGR